MLGLEQELFLEGVVVVGRGLEGLVQVFCLLLRLLEFCGQGLLFLF